MIEYSSMETEEPDAKADEFGRSGSAEPDASTVTNEMDEQPQTEPETDHITDDSETHDTIAEPVEVNPND